MNTWIETAQLGSALLKGSGLLLLTSFLVLLMRNASATSQFRVCFVGISMSLLVAVASIAATLSKLDIPVTSEALVSAQQSTALWFNKPFSIEHIDQFDNLNSAAPTNNPTIRHTNDVDRDTLSSDFALSPIAAPDSRSAKVTTANDNALQQQAISWVLNFLGYWPCVWVIVAGVILLRSLLQHMLAFRMFKRYRTTEDENVMQLANQIARRLDISPPQLLVGADSLTPFVTGLWKPKIVLPPDLHKWSIQKMTFVLLHEMSHIKRRDLLTQLIAKAAVAVYWFNPLSWWSFARLMRLRELACDDCVLLQEESPGIYAETLLDVASKYCAKSPAYGIGMSGKLDITHRIRCALDATAARTSFSNRRLRYAAGVSLVLRLILGAIQPWVRAAEPKADEATATSTEKEKPVTSIEAKADEQIDEEARSMLIMVVDEQLQPLQGVDIDVNGIDYDRPSKLGNLPRVHYPTDASGEAHVKLRKGNLSLQFWLTLDGYVPQYIQFQEKNLPLPKEYTFYFEKGERISGKIVDAAGHPIENVTVSVSASHVNLNEHARKASLPAQFSGSLGEIKTNAEGRWEISNAPQAARNPEITFGLRVDHPDFASDRTWNNTYQSKQPITAQQFKDGTATLVMDSGAILRGKITGPNGEPVTKGLVIWDDNPYFAVGVNEQEIHSDGTYQLPALAFGKYPITVIAPGYAPDQRKLDLNSSSPVCDFQLEPGNPIRIEIVDSNGKPIPKAIVALARDGWRGNTAMYNDEHSGVLDSGIPRRADESGVYTWDWAPADGVKYEIYKSGYDTKSVTLVAKPQAHRIVLTAPMKISGSVVDAKTAAPIKDFKVMPVKVFRPDFYSTDFQETRVVLGKDGKFEMPLTSQGGASDTFRVRIEADGYRTAFGNRWVATGDSPLVEDFQLESFPALVGHVVKRDGRPVNKFQVAIGSATTAPRFEFERPDTNFGQAFEVDGDSKFQIAASFEPQRLRVFDNESFAEVVILPYQKEIGKVVLQPYANISGRLMQGDTPIGNEVIYFSPLVRRGLTEARFQDSFYAKTDPDGYFDFKRLPPIVGSVHAYLGPWRDSSLTSSQSIAFDLQSGDYEQITLGGKGIPITGRVVAIGRSDDKFSKQWSLNWLVSRKQGVALPPDTSKLSIPPSSGPIESAWLQHTDFSDWLATKENHFVKLRADGSFNIHGVSAGEYDLVIQLYDQPAGCLIEAVGTRVVPVTITDEELGKNKLELGAIEVECQSGPRPGSDMRAYEFANADGKVVYVNDLAGRYILFHLWASWCAPCLASMPELKEDIAKFENASFTAVGFNIDADKKNAQDVTAKQGLAWAQNYVGENSNFSRQLAASSVPAYYLIGPDGKLVGSSSEWKEMHKMLEENLKH